MKEAAARLVEPLLAPLGDRLLHTVAVADRACELARTVPEADRDLLVAAAWLHDVGYAPGLADTGFHPLDGARFLVRRGCPARLVALVAHHSGARFEAAERGLEAQLYAYELEDSPVMDALVAADLTTGPQGQRTTYQARVAEILVRYAPESPVHRAVVNARDCLFAHVERVRCRVHALS